MKMVANCTALFAAIAGACLYLSLSHVISSHPKVATPAVDDRVVLSAPMQLILSGGDRFLAADIEAIRATATWDGRSEATDTLFRARAYHVVMQLNPCHEDAVYLANALLSWGGESEQGADILRRSIACRFWDEFPPFLYGMNQLFFLHDAAGAAVSLELAASRSTKNAAAMRNTAIMIRAEQFHDEQAAMTYLRAERDLAKDPVLKDMLDKRVRRLANLLLLRNAQRLFEQRQGRALSAPEELIKSGILTGFPSDPLGIGYEFTDGRFILHERKIAGFEGAR